MRDLLSNAKRILAFVLTFAMLFSGSAVSVLAEEANSDVEEAVVTEIDETEAEENTAEAVAVTETEDVQENTTADSAAEVLAIEEDGVGVTSDTNGQEIVSSLNGISSDTSLMRATLTTKFKTRKITVDNKKYSESYTERSVKVTWKKPKGSSAKYYRLERMKMDGTDAEVLQSETDRKKRSKRSYTDKIDAKSMDANATYIYVVTCFDKFGQPTSDKKVAAVASPTILFAQTSEDTSYTQVYFSLQNGPVNYVLERSDKSNKDKYYTNTVADVDVSALDGTEVVTTYNGTPAICVTDKTGNFALGSSHYYRVKAYVKDLEEGNEITSLYSKGLKVKSTLPDPELLSITGTHANNEVCYKNGTFRFTKLDVESGQVQKYSILRSLYPDRGFKAIKTVKVNSLMPITVTNLNGEAVTGYEITYNKMTPTVPYYYRVRAIGKKNLAGAMSNVIQNTCQFAPVTDLEVASDSIKQLNVSWRSEECALKYVIERSGPYTVSTNEIDPASWKKIATVSNKPKDGFVQYSDKKKIVRDSFYFYRIYPVNGKSIGTACVPEYGFSKIGAPKLTKAAGAGINAINLTWKKTYGAKTYTIQRTTVTDLNGNPVFDTCEQFGPFDSQTSEFKKCIYEDKTAKPFITYFYRMQANDGEHPSDFDRANVLSATTKPLAVKNFKVIVNATDDTKSWPGLKIQWTTNAEKSQINHYRIERKIGSDSSWELWKKCTLEETKKMDSKNYTMKVTDDVSYVKGQSYEYRIYAVYTEGTQELLGQSSSGKLVLPKSISLNDENHTMKVGETYKIRVDKYSPKETTYKDITYSIDDKSIVEKKSSGNDDGKPYIEIKAKKAGKTEVDINPRFGSGMTETCTITVTN